MNLSDRVFDHFAESIKAKQDNQELLAEATAAAIELMFAALVNDGKVLACGNGGSAADAQHFAAELVGRFEMERMGLAGIALTTDTSALTAIANDYDFNRVFSKQVEALGRSGDVLLAISTSGNSANIIAAIEAAHERDMRVVALTGNDVGRIARSRNRQQYIATATQSFYLFGKHTVKIVIVGNRG